MSEKQYQRRPIKNFLIKKDLQIRYIVKIVLAVVLIAAITTAILTLVYYYKSGSGYFYFMSNDLLEDLQRQSILETILPSLLIAELISILLGIIIGFLSSRKIAVPIYKIEQWLARLIKGDYGAQIYFREKDEFESLCMQCNYLSGSLQSRLGEIRDKLEEIEKSSADSETKKKIEAIKDSLTSASST